MKLMRNSAMLIKLFFLILCIARVLPSTFAGSGVLSIHEHSENLVSSNGKTYCSRNCAGENGLVFALRGGRGVENGNIVCETAGRTFDVETLKPARLPPLNVIKGRKEVPVIRQTEARKQEIGAGKSDKWDDGRMSHVSPCSRLSPLLERTKSEGAEELSEGEEHQEAPFKVGDVLNKRISILGVLGSGAFGTVYIAWDKQTDAHLAVKVQRAGKKHVQVAQDEILLLSAVKRGSETLSKGSDCVVQIVGAFGIPSPHGRQICLALELLGPSLLDLIIDHSYAGCPIPMVASVMRDVLAGLDYLHSGCNIVHTDVKPENVLLRLPSSPADWWTENREDEAPDGSASKLRKGWAEQMKGPVRAKLVDLGNSCFANRPFTQDIQTIEYRCPEVILGAGFSTSADIWSAACIGFELLTGEYLFDPQVGRDNSGEILYEKEDDLLALHQELLGTMPPHLALRGTRSPQFMDEEGKLKRIKSLKFWALEDVLVEKYGMDREEANEVSSFFLPMLRFDPKERSTAAEMLEHPWLKKHAGRL
mmetsp:Transcript_23361/g.75951  ORF Transcript_23361/g.75951 Transcript_23361/m.75951 type:complete len:535 (-) Transcript_23361:1560-3164(-)